MRPQFADQADFFRLMWVEVYSFARPDPLIEDKLWGKSRNTKKKKLRKFTTVSVYYN